MKILVPCDFSKSSNNAALYAAKFAEIVSGEIILFNVVHIETPPMVQFFGFIEDKVGDIRVSDVSQEGAVLTNELKSKVKGFPISFELAKGYPIEDVIENYASAHDIDLIIMGTKGASGLEKVIFGSNAVAVINKSSKPVITVPEYSRFNNLEQIVYASDMHAIQPEIQKIIPLAKLFASSINILHVLPPDSMEKIDTVAIKNELIQKYEYQKISFHISFNRDVLEGINDFVADVKADLLAMYTHEMGFFDKLITTSFSREEAFHSLIPLLTLKK